MARRGRCSVGGLTHQRVGCATVLPTFSLMTAELIPPDTTGRLSFDRPARRHFKASYMGRGEAGKRRDERCECWILLAKAVPSPDPVSGTPTRARCRVLQVEADYSGYTSDKCCSSFTPAGWYANNLLSTVRPFNIWIARFGGFQPTRCWTDSSSWMTVASLAN